MESPGRVSNNKLTLYLSDHLLPSAPHSDPKPAPDLSPCTYCSLYLVPPSKPSHSPSLPTRVPAPTPDLKETLVALSLKPACYCPS